MLDVAEVGDVAEVEVVVADVDVSEFESVVVDADVEEMEDEEGVDEDVCEVEVGTLCRKAGSGCAVPDIFVYDGKSTTYSRRFGLTKGRAQARSFKDALGKK